MFSMEKTYSSLASIFLVKGGIMPDCFLCGYLGK